MMKVGGEHYWINLLCLIGAVFVLVNGCCLPICTPGKGGFNQWCHCGTSALGAIVNFFTLSMSYSCA